MDADVVYFGPVTLATSDVLGRHFIASRVIQPNEVILKDTSVFAHPWCTNKSAIICLGCFKELDLTTTTLCRLCKWPVCSDICGEMFQHGNAECKILRENDVAFNYVQPRLSYICIKALRGLLVNEKCPETFAKMRKLESHIAIRAAAEKTAYFIDFIWNKCKLNQYDEETIKHVFGIADINAFICPDGYGYGLYLFASMFAHDCAPNTSIISSRIEGGSGKYRLTFTAARLINPGDIVTTYYVDISAGVIERRERLKLKYCFDCECNRCQNELKLKELESSQK